MLYRSVKGATVRLVLPSLKQEILRSGATASQYCVWAASSVSCVECELRRVKAEPSTIRIARPAFLSDRPKIFMQHFFNQTKLFFLFFFVVCKSYFFLFFLCGVVATTLLLLVFFDACLRAIFILGYVQSVFFPWAPTIYFCAYLWPKRFGDHESTTR